LSPSEYAKYIDWHDDTVSVRFNTGLKLAAGELYAWGEALIADDFPFLSDPEPGEDRRKGEHLLTLAVDRSKVDNDLRRQFADAVGAKHHGKATAKAVIERDAGDVFSGVTIVLELHGWALRPPRRAVPGVSGALVRPEHHGSWHYEIVVSMQRPTYDPGPITALTHEVADAFGLFLTNTGPIRPHDPKVRLQTQPRFGWQGGELPAFDITTLQIDDA